MAPECFKKDRKNSTQFYSGKKADVWALGLCIYALAFNDLPFTMGQGVETRFAHQNMKDKDLCFDDQRRNVSDALKNFLRKVLEQNTNERPTIHEL